MARPNSRETFTDFCLRQLGGSVIGINMSDEQVDDCVDLALQYWRDFHFDGTEHWYVSHQISQDDLDNKYFEIDPKVIGITRVFPVGSSNASVNMFDLRYQMRLHDLYDFTSTSYVNYVLTQQHITTLNMLFTGEAPIRFNRHTHKLYCDWNWGKLLQVGEWVVFEGFKIVDEDAYADMWDDRMLKSLCVAYLKRTWAANMKKYDKVQLLGGIVMTGAELYAEAVNEIAILEDKIEKTYQEPPRFIIG